MTTKAEFESRYNTVQRTVDPLGRSIGVKRLRPSQALKIVGMTPDLEGITMKMPRSDGTLIDVPYRSQAIIAASVAEVDGAPIPFPKTRAELDAIMDSLDTEGLNAAGEAMALLMVGDEEIDAKNSPGTPSSEANSGSSETESRSMSPSVFTTRN